MVFILQYAGVYQFCIHSLHSRTANKYSLGDLYSLDSDFSDFSYSFYFSLTLYELFLIYFSMIFALISQGRSMNVWCVVKAVAVLLHYLVIFTLDYESRI
ncbi:hypothetical protein GLYMA_02G080951v4 [Glycine max]|nr:hypothetical protein GLYMA_02G080951v4 [Glycine max]KAH1059291.1 hypothetical protein GYH30_003371 [Glycine max]